MNDEELGELLIDSLEEIKDIHDDIKKKIRARRWAIRLALTSGVVALLLGAWNLKLSHDIEVTSNKIDRETCLQSNESRLNLREGFDFLVDQLVGENPSADTLEKADIFKEAIAEKFDTVEC